MPQPEEPIETDNEIIDTIPEVQFSGSSQIAYEADAKEIRMDQ